MNSIIQKDLIERTNKSIDNIINIPVEKISFDSRIPLDNDITDSNKVYKGEVTIDHYGRRIPKHAHGTANLPGKTSSTKLITDAVMALFDRIVNPKLLVRRVTLTANRVVDEKSVVEENTYEQMNLFTDYEASAQKREEEQAELEREKRMQQEVLSIKKKFGKNAILKGMNLQEGATTVDRNNQIGGHKA